jgi:hypothetical protein
MMVGLIDAQYLDFFDEKLVIKTFSAMLVPVKRCETIIIWHLFYNPSGRISYLESCKLQTEDIDSNVEIFSKLPTCWLVSEHEIHGWYVVMYST